MKTETFTKVEDVISGYRHTVLHDSPVLDPEQHRAWAKELARLAGAFRPDCVDALTNAYTEMFPIAH